MSSLQQRTGENFLRWFLSFWIGVITALVAVFIDYFVGIFTCCVESLSAPSARDTIRSCQQAVMLTHGGSGVLLSVSSAQVHVDHRW